MVCRAQRIRKIGLVIIMLGIAACAPPSRFPEPPTPIPTLAPVTEIPSAIDPTQPPTFAILSYPARPPSASAGEEIFTTHCAQCHGEDGTGLVPGSRNFLDLDYIRGETPADFYSAVTEGRGEMPAYNDIISSDERWDVVFFVWRLSTTSDFIESGREVYEQSCLTCHGEGGSGELLGSANFTDLRQMDNLAPRDLYLVTTQGRGSMPAWQSLLSQDQRWAVIDYIRSFTYDPVLAQEVGLVPTTTAPTSPPPGVAVCPQDQVNPLAWDDDDAIQSGQAIYLVQCAMCHGPDGSGGLPQTPDFTSAEISTNLKTVPGTYMCSLTEGKGVMPAFGASLSETESWEVLTFMGSLGP